MGRPLAVGLRRAGIKLLIAGGGPLTGLAKRLEKRLDNVKYLGFVYGDEKSLLIANARAPVFPSLVVENMPMSIAEALSLGTPVVAFNVGGQAELVRVSGGGVLGEAFDAGRLAELTVEVSTDARVFSELSLSGWRWASGNLAPSSYVARLEHVVDSIL